MVGGAWLVLKGGVRGFHRGQQGRGVVGGLINKCSERYEDFFSLSLSLSH